MSREIKKPAFNQKSSGVKLSSNLPIPGSEDSRYPIFCFRNLHTQYGVESCIQTTHRNFERALIKKLKQLADQTWNTLQLSALGSEKIEIGSINPSLPIGAPKGVTHLLSFYFAGDKARLIGHKNGDTFHIYFIDTNLSVYKH